MTKKYVYVVKGKGTEFYNIGVSDGVGVIIDTFGNLPFKVQLVSSLKTERFLSVKHWLHDYFAAYQTNDGWFKLADKQADELKEMLSDPDNLISDQVSSGYPRVVNLPYNLWDQLDKLAEQTNSLVDSGEMLGRPTVDALLKRIVNNSRLMKIIKNELNSNKVADISDKYKEAVIVKPENSKTETIAWLNVDGNKISVDFPERNDDFKEIVKSFGLRWDGEAETRTLDFLAGNVSDRIAELGHNLLVNGFSVTFSDEHIQEMAITGTYEPECRRWITAMVGGKYDGWFVIRWMYPEDCYDIARSVSGSRYNKPSVVVPPEQFAEVIDFAQIHKFRFSEGALALVVRAKSMLDNALIVDVKQREEDDYSLNIPELDWKDDDLEDDLKFDGPPDTTN